MCKCTPNLRTPWCGKPGCSIEEELDKNKTYSIPAECDNCDFRGRITIPEGVRISARKCPTCGCNSLTKVNEFRS